MSETKSLWRPGDPEESLPKLVMRHHDWMQVRRDVREHGRGYMAADEAGVLRRIDPLTVTVTPKS